MKGYTNNQRYLVLSSSALSYIEEYISEGASATRKKRKVSYLESLSNIRDWFKRHEAELINQLAFHPFWRRYTLLVYSGMRITQSHFLRLLAEFGYRKNKIAVSPGEYAHRGGVVDVFPINSGRPLRMEFVGNQIERIGSYQAGEEKEEDARLIVPGGDHIFRAGEYVVHIDHGIGQYEKLFKKNVNYYHVLKYADGDRLLVPRQKQNRLSPYVGFSKPRIHRLGGGLWERTKKGAQKEIFEFARTLLENFAQRKVIHRPPYPKEAILLEELSSSFVYKLTKDQRQALIDIEKDFGKDKPMQRLLCGDVGFGKTEVAIRASARVVSGGKQVFLVAPTTVLAYQHYLTFSKRFEKLPVKIAMLSRVVKKKQQQSILRQVAEGEVDILIGTHRLFSDDIAAYDLGLLVIDEEQRFGVRHKEKLIALAKKVDVLSLSATPIPRTLFMALSGVRDINVIRTPPLERHPIQTHVLPFSIRKAKKALEFELKRGGQVYWLHNSIGTIVNAQKRIKRLLPGVRIGVIHGRLPETQIVETLDRFRTKEIDILVATTIIENGLDFPSVNTLIVEDATRLGLAQAHQLRGRVGRSFQKAKAFFFYPAKPALSAEAAERLEALKRYTALGEGYELALRDLEIRGSGNILGKQQSGTANAIGLNLYFEMLSSAIEKLRKNNRRQ